MGWAFLVHRLPAIATNSNATCRPGGGRHGKEISARQMMEGADREREMIGDAGSDARCRPKDDEYRRRLIKARTWGYCDVWRKKRMHAACRAG